MSRLPTGLALLLTALLLAGCSSLTLGYNQLPRLAGWWADGYLDFDRAQRRQFDEAVQQLLSWHRREELPRWQQLLEQADAALEGGVSEPELLQLEAELNASVERTLQRAAPLMQPLLAGLREAQWLRLQARLDEGLQDWRERQSGSEAGIERSKQFSRALARWLGTLERPLRDAALAEASAWRFDTAALVEARKARQTSTVRALRLWASGDAAGGTALLMAGTRERSAAQLAQRQQVLASAQRLLAAPSPRQLRDTRAHWAGWQADLRALQAER